MTDFSFPSAALSLMRRLEEYNFQAWIVGGAVRDSILGLPIHDVDIASQAKPEEIKAIFEDVKTIDVGISFGTVRVLWEDAIFELTTFRADGDYEDGRHPTEVFYSDRIEDDLKRRDFTINAMAWNPSRGLLDLFGGRVDLEDGLIRAVGCAEDRIGEDALRMLRAVRFAARFGFQLEETLMQAILNRKKGLEKVSVERSFIEMDQILCHRRASDGIRLLEETGLLTVLLPELSWKTVSDRERTGRLLSLLPADSSLRWAALFRYLTDETIDAVRLARESLDKLKSSRLLRDEVSLLLACRLPDQKPDLYAVKRLMAETGPSFDKLVCFLEADRISRDREDEEVVKVIQSYGQKIRDERLAIRTGDLAINGKDLLEIGYNQGRDLGRTLEELLEQVMRGKLANTREELLDYAGLRKESGQRIVNKQSREVSRGVK